MSFPVWIPFENEWWTFGIFLAAILGLVGISEIINKGGWISPDANRRWVHFFVGISVSITPFIFSSNVQPTALATLFIILNSLAFKKDSFKGIHSQDRKSFGTIYFPVGYLLLILGFWSFPEFLVVSLLILAISDPLAAQVGQSTQNPSIFKLWTDEKTIQGTVAFFISSFLIVYMMSHFLLGYSNNYLVGLALFTAFGATVAEVTSCRGTDNISIPLVSILFMIGFEDHVTETGTFFNLSISDSAIILFYIVLLFSLAYHFHSLTRSGFYGGLIMGIIITLIGSWRFLVPLAVFFVLTSILSKIIKNTSFYRSKGSRRDIVQVYANGGIALLICIIDFIQPNGIYFFLFLASVSAAMADTWATEFGKLSNKKPVSILNLMPMQHGISGGITRIGTIGSILGACLMGLTVWLSFPMPTFVIYGIILSGFLGSIFDSILGATVQAKYETQIGETVETPETGARLISGHPWINNDVVNILNTTFAPIVMYIYLSLF